MSRTATIPIIARLQAGMPGAVAAWGRGSVVAVLITLSLALLGEGAPGDLDPSFGAGGIVTTDFADSAQADSLVVQPDGKLVAAGLSFIIENGSLLDIDFALARYRADGSLDPSFGVGGKVTTDIQVLAQGSSLVRQPDGKLVLAGGFGDFILVRYRPNGRLDPNFGVGGIVTTDFGGLEAAGALVLQPDGKLVAAGRASDDFALARYRPDGSLDPKFGNEGTVTTDLEGDNQVFALVLQSNGKLVAAGSAGGDMALARYRR